MRIAIMLSLWLCAASAFGADINAYVINTSGETLDKIALPSGVVTKNVLTLGSDLGCFPNQTLGLKKRFIYHGRC